jgi:hypothetical protein
LSPGAGPIHSPEKQYHLLTETDHAPVHFAKTYPVRRQALRKQIATSQAIILLTAVLFFLSFASGSEPAEQKTEKKEGRST